MLTNQPQAQAFIDGLPHGPQKLLTIAAFSHAIGLWFRDPRVLPGDAANPFDALLYVESISRFFEDTELIRKIAAGEISSLTDLENEVW